MEFEIAEPHTCINCNVTIAADSRFCNHCGCLQAGLDPVKEIDKWVALKQTALFYALQLSICLMFKFADNLQTFGWLIICDLALAATAISFFVYNWEDNRKLLRWPDFSIQKLALYSAIALAASLMVHYMVTWLNYTLFSREINYYYYFLANGHGKLWMIASVAVVPALFEELAYRGFVLQNLTNIIDAKQAAFATSFLFALIHLSFLSMFWLIPFALLLAHVRLREKTIWYGVCIHFCFNLTVCVLEIFNQANAFPL